MEEPPADAPESALSRFVLRAALADPAHLPELLANFAVRHLGRRAVDSVARARTGHPEAGAAELRTMVITRGRRVSQTEGAFVGGPLLVLAPFAFCAALLTQSRMVLELAAVAGREATDPARAAELLVIQGVYPDEERAAAALEAAAAKARPDAPPGRTAALVILVKRMAYLLGLVTPDQRPVSAAVRIWRWVLVGAVLLVGLVAPLIWLPYLGHSYHRATQDLGERASRYYLGETVPPPVATDRARPALVGGIVNALLSLVVPIGTVVFLVLADVRLMGSQYPAIAVSLIVLTLAVNAAWYVRRRRRRRSAA
ncbi:hypothetical protein AB0G79_11555 [Streptomyces sp. NPDC020807]|uniref:hypothetical protein n=1 Tax=Streptomyces sp. NPDC020807 TaxID=3155119 RepID=UPI0034091651